MQRIIYALVTLTLLACGAVASDWPQFRGPNHDGVAEAGAFALWPAGGPKKLWTAQVGAGCAGLVVAGGKVFAQGNNGSEALDKENKSQDTIWCLDAESGKEIWKQSYDAPFLRVSDSGGPNATPAADGTCVVTVSKTRTVRCFEAAGGKLLWSRNFSEEAKIEPEKLSKAFMYGGVASSPLILGKIVLVEGLGLDKENGKTVYEVKIQTGNLNRYVSPTPMKIDGKTQVALAFGRYPRQGLLFIDPATGEAKGELLCRAGSADPLLIDGNIFISERWMNNEGGSCLYAGGAISTPVVGTAKPLPPEYNPKPAPKAPAQQASAKSEGEAPAAPAIPTKPTRPGPPEPTPQWCVTGDGAYWGNAVRWGDYIFTGEMKNMACISIKSGEVKWREKSLTNCQPVVCDGKLIVMNYNKLLILDAGPEYKVLASADVLPATSSNAYAKFSLTPALVPGRLYCKQSNGDVVCLDVSGK
jgi:outer membrane protein assembly factor BamB